MNQNQYSQQNYYPSYTTSSSTIDSVLEPWSRESVSKLCEAFGDLGIGFSSDLTTGQSQNQLRTDQMLLRQQKSGKVPSGDYMCHVCFQKDHFIRDCPQVSEIIE